MQTMNELLLRVEELEELLQDCRLRTANAFTSVPPIVMQDLKLMTYMTSIYNENRIVKELSYMQGFIDATNQWKLASAAPSKKDYRTHMKVHCEMVDLFDIEPKNQPEYFSDKECMGMRRLDRDMAPAEPCRKCSRYLGNRKKG